MSQTSRRSFLRNQFALGATLPLLGEALFSAPNPGSGQESPSRQLFEAVARGDVEEVDRLLDRDLGLLRAHDDLGRSAFAVALLARHPAVAERLRARGFRPDLHESALALDWDLFGEQAATTPGLVNAGHPIGGSAMHAAATGGAGAEIWRVYSVAGQPNARPGRGDGRRGASPLRAALEHPELAVAEMTAATLLANGADPQPVEEDGTAPLHLAAARGSVEIVEMLVRKGADPLLRDAAQRTPIELAEEKGHELVAEMLGRHRTIPRDCSTSRRAYDVDGRAFRQPDLSAFAPVYLERTVGVAHFDLEEVRRRVEANPEVATAIATTTEGAVEACSHTGRLELVDFLLDHGAPYSLPTAVVRGDVARARALLAEDPRRIHERGPHDFALLWYPVIGGGNLELAEILLAAGAEVERQHHLGTTALHWAALSDDVDMAALLLEHGAEVDRAGRKFGGVPRTPLELAVERSRDAVARLLRDRGARG